MSNVNITGLAATFTPLRHIDSSYLPIARDAIGMIPNAVDLEAGIAKTVKVF